MASVATSACSSGGSAITGALISAAFPNRAVENASLDPRFTYIRVVRDGRVAYLARGYADQTTGGLREVFYTAENETLTLVNGRVVGFSSTEIAFRLASGAVMPGPSAGSNRLLDVLPNGPFNVSQTVSERFIKPAPALSGSPQLAQASQLDWVEQMLEQDGQIIKSQYGYERLIRDVSGPAKAKAAEHIQSFEWFRQIPVYSEQCPVLGFCLTIERWPVKR